MNLPGLFVLLTCIIANGKAQDSEEKKIAFPQSKNLHSKTNPKLIVCYYADWKHNPIDGNPCTHIIYAFLPVLNNGTIPEINQGQKGNK